MTGLLECDKVSPITHQVWHPLHKYFLQPFFPPDGGDKSNRFSTRHNWRARLNSLSFGPRTSIKFTGRANSPFSLTWGGNRNALLPFNRTSVSSLSLRDPADYLFTCRGKAEAAQHLRRPRTNWAGQRLQSRINIILPYDISDQLRMGHFPHWHLSVETACRPGGR